MDLFKYTKKYVWNEEKTPYFIRVQNLTRVQADNEVRIYVALLALLFVCLTLLFLTGCWKPFHATSDGSGTGGSLPVGCVAGGRSLPISAYCFSVLAAALMFGLTKHISFALYCGAAPAAALLYLTIEGFHPDQHPDRRLLIIIAILLWQRYVVRTIALSRSYERLPETRPDNEVGK